jgi:hypothetical protein
VTLSSTPVPWHPSSNSCPTTTSQCEPKLLSALRALFAYNHKAKKNHQSSRWDREFDHCHSCCTLALRQVHPSFTRECHACIHTHNRRLASSHHQLCRECELQVVGRQELMRLEHWRMHSQFSVTVQSLSIRFTLRRCSSSMWGSARR